VPLGVSDDGFPDAYLKGVVTGSIPIVTIDRPIEVTTTDSVGSEDRLGAVMAVDHLIEHGYIGSKFRAPSIGLANMEIYLKCQLSKMLLSTYGNKHLILMEVQV